MITGIPDKHYLRIGEVSALTGLPTSVLRYWETEFSSLAPKKSSSGQRLYTRKDVELVAEIKELLYAEKLTIEGARKRLEKKKKYRRSDLSGEALATLLQDVKLELTSLRDQL
ncbi:MerR family transcriptional regulator [Geomonas sp. Red69]|uniref:MerR family transcriptional regulator n=1 Tax=Geomonas diazotrophica TaxID=2843197 RepID=A0ABX8JNI6_9BACT|nr:MULTISPECIES: MerR family transcriptional regulator [Geomonas]MBU5638951.1 MerR family transcriptional regulator [Geomonas diazotrophica]QWV99239.1 MerR family transcriptional regulator [Geomonas nitrogeniifigens]QXE88408.1 MerR family transcriptional regulator [Geomonas nitrogeniifigens]